MLRIATNMETSPWNFTWPSSLPEHYWRTQSCSSFPITSRQSLFCLSPLFLSKPDVSRVQQSGENDGRTLLQTFNVPEILLFPERHRQDAAVNFPIATARQTQCQELWPFPYHHNNLPLLARNHIAINDRNRILKQSVDWTCIIDLEL